MPPLEARTLSLLSLKNLITVGYDKGFSVINPLTGQIILHNEKGCSPIISDDDQLIAYNHSGDNANMFTVYNLAHQTSQSYSTSNDQPIQKLLSFSHDKKRIIVTKKTNVEVFKEIGALREQLQNLVQCDDRRLSDISLHIHPKDRT